MTFIKKTLTADRTIQTEFMNIYYYDFTKPSAIEYYSNDYLRICTILEGEKIVRVNDREKIRYSVNDFALLAPNSKVELEMFKQTKAVVFEIDDNLINKVIDKVTLDFDEDNLMEVSEDFSIGKFNVNTHSTYNRIIELYNGKEKNKEFLIDIYAHEMIYDILKYHGSQNILTKKNDSKIYNIVNFLNDNYSEKIKLSSIAHDFDMNEYELTRYFKKYKNKTPHEYIKELKMKRAKELLYSQSVTETCFDIGYENVSHFISDFKNCYGITPKQFQKTLMTV